MADGLYTRDENEAEQLDRHWLELLQELRVAQTGIQILFAFLLVIAFSLPFQEAGDFAHIVFAVTLVLTAMAAGLLIAPVSVHRMVYRRRLRPELVRTAARMAVGGLVLMLGSVAGGLLLALDVVLPRQGAIAVVVGVMVWFSVFWYVVPFELRRKRPAVRASSDENAASNRR
jgi:heme O synthase-like polyprenyltransferase